MKDGVTGIEYGPVQDTALSERLLIVEYIHTLASEALSPAPFPPSHPSEKTVHATLRRLAAVIAAGGHVTPVDALLHMLGERQ
jgi:hypothetical protein